MYQNRLIDRQFNVNLNNQYWLQVYNAEYSVLKKPVGIFWDIENCRIPKGISPSFLVENIRALTNEFNLIENDFVIVCDVFAMNNNVINELNNMQVNIIHVSSFAKNACDEKIKQLINRFVHTHRQNCAIILLSSK